MRKGQDGPSADSIAASALDRLAAAAASQQAASSQPVMSQEDVTPQLARPAQQRTAAPQMSQGTTAQRAPASQILDQRIFFVGSNDSSRERTIRVFERLAGQPQDIRTGAPIAPAGTEPYKLTDSYTPLINPSLKSKDIPNQPLISLSQLLEPCEKRPLFVLPACPRVPRSFQAADVMLRSLVHEFLHLKNTYYHETSNDYQAVSERCGQLAHELRLVKLQLGSTKAGLLNNVASLERTVTTRNERIRELEIEVKKLTDRLVIASLKAGNGGDVMKDPETRLLAQGEEIQELTQKLKARDTTIETYEKILTGSADVFSQAVQHSQNNNQNNNQNQNQNNDQNNDQNQNQNQNQNNDQNES